MSEVWPKHFVAPKEEPPENIPWETIESHERSRAVILKAIELGKVSDAATLLAREWNIPSIALGLEAHISKNYEGKIDRYRTHLSEAHPPIPREEFGERTTDLEITEKVSNPNEKWRFDPELNFVARKLLARDDVSGLQIVQILSRLGKTPGYPTLDTVKQFIQRNGGRVEAQNMLEKSARPLPRETEDELAHRSDEARRLTPQKIMSPWLNNERARALTAILLSNPKIPMSVVLDALSKHCGLRSMLKSAIRKPMVRFKSQDDEEDLDYEPRQLYAEALAADCERFDAATYAEMAEIAKDVELHMPKSVPPDIDAIKSAAWARLPLAEKLRQLRERIQMAAESLERGVVTLPPLTSGSEQHLQNADFADLTLAIRERRPWSMPHIGISFSEQAYRAGGVVDTSLLVPTVTVNINLEGGTDSSRARARLVHKFIREELVSQRRLTYEKNTAILDSMLTASEERRPLFRFEWRDTSQAWLSRKRAGELTDSERALRVYQMPLSRLNALTKPPAQTT